MRTRLKNIKEMSVADRPREKFLHIGPGGLSNAELIAIILRSGSQSMPLVTICKTLIDHIDDNISTLGTMTIEEIAKVKGLGQIKAMELLAAIELGKRSLRRATPLNLKDDKEVEKLIKPYLTVEKKLQYHLVLINNRNELLATSEMETEKGQLPDLKKIIKLVLEAGAAEIVLCRNAVKLPVSFQNEERAYIIQLDAAANMLQINMRGLLIIS
jgi:DNA repair protein RadC